MAYTQLLACSSSQSVITIACCLLPVCALVGRVAMETPPLASALFGSTDFVGTNAQAHLLVMSLTEYKSVLCYFSFRKCPSS